MNPFKDIDSETGLLINKKSPHFGRYRLAVNQVCPFREPNYNRLILKVKDNKVCEGILEWFHDSLRLLFHLFKQREIKTNKLWQLDFFDNEQQFLVFEQIHDVSYIGIENIYFAFNYLSLVLEDCHFFLYSEGDCDDRWLDEYKIKNNTFFFQRNICKDEIHIGRLNFYINRAKKNLNDKAFKQFTLFQIYAKLNFWTNKNIQEYSTIGVVIASTLAKITKTYFIEIYNLDDECPDLTSLNNKYKFNTMKLL